MSVRLYVGNLPKEDIEPQDLQAIFAEVGDRVSTKLIKDRKTRKCRGFGFVTVENDEEADEIIEKFNGYMFKDTPIKLEKALPRAKGGKGDEEYPRPASPILSSSGGSTPSPNTSPSPSNSGSGSGGSGGGGGSSSGRRNNKKSRRGAPTTTTTSAGSNSEGIQPDPRWAAELSKLKEMLAAQASNT